MLQGYPFWSDAGAPTTPTIYDPILEAAATTLTFRGKNRDVTVIGASVGADTPTFLNNIRLKVGNSAPGYRYYELSTQGFDHDTDLVAGCNILNYIDLGGIQVQEGETITLSAVGTGAFSGVLWVEDGEPGPIPIPNGDVVMFRMGGTNDGGATLAATGFDMDSRTPENNRLYTPFMVQVNPENDSVEAVIMRAGKESMTFPPIGRMVYPYAPLQFSGLEYNQGSVVGKLQVAAASKVDIRIWCIESPMPGIKSSPSAPNLKGVTSPKIPGSVAVAGIVSGETGGGGMDIADTGGGMGGFFGG